MNQQEMQQLAEREYPVLSFNQVNGDSTEMYSGFYNENVKIERAAFIKGLQTGLRMDRWVSVEERLPTKDDADKDNEVLVFTDSGDKYIEAWDDVQYFKSITHWMHLNLPPKPKTK
jgi:hypothetical protein